MWVPLILFKFNNQQKNLFNLKYRVELISTKLLIPCERNMSQMIMDILDLTKKFYLTAKK